MSPSTGGSLTLLYAVGAAVIGGTSLFGGKGRIMDAVLGGLVIAVINNGMLLLDQPSGRVYIVTGLVLLLAASVDAISRRKASGVRTGVTAVPASPASGKEQLRRNNMSRLLTRVHVSGPTSRAALTRETGLNRSTIGDLCGELEALGLVREDVGVLRGRSGRPSHVVEPRSDNAVIAVDLGVDRISVAVVGLGGEVLERRVAPAPHRRARRRARRRVAGPDGHRGARRPRRTSAASASGVSVPGAVRDRDGLVRFAPNLGWVDEPFTELLAQRLGAGIPVFTGNDANLGALAEHVRGAAVGRSEVAYLSGSVGIGGGFLVNAQPMSGASGYAGEIGHMLVDSNGPACRCGNIGCWEMKIGENQILTQSGRLPGGGPAGRRRGDRGRSRGRAARDRRTRHRRGVDRRRAARADQHLQPRGGRPRWVAGAGLGGRGRPDQRRPRPHPARVPAQPR